LGSKEIGSRKSEFVAKTQFLSWQKFWGNIKETVIYLKPDIKTLFNLFDSGYSN